MLPLELALTFPGTAMIIPFSPKIEARIGADWGWAFVGPGGHCQCMLVQAKRLDDNDRRYGSLFYKGRKGTGKQPVDQLNTFIASANRYKLPPIYLFYNHVSDTTCVPSARCGTLNLLNARFPQSWGVGFASAISVKHARPDNTFDRHRSHSRPFHCLLCSAGTQRTELGSAGAAAAVLSDLFEGTSEEGGLVTDLMPPYEASMRLPELFRRAEGVARAREEDLEAAFAEIRSELQDSAA